jgi:hypothetical protein
MLQAVAFVSFFTHHAAVSAMVSLNVSPAASKVPSAFFLACSDRFFLSTWTKN